MTEIIENLSKNSKPYIHQIGQKEHRWPNMKSPLKILHGICKKKVLFNEQHMMNDLYCLVEAA